ncbi:hypothetical protein F3Y22_tig00111852pilonHSYRG00029 [Hibiscus syriacus]|uniref:Uncharacterized protein n=1 Tax=Hibiscus syriacus TaxID=106335 RepID=A0A6A2X9V9_HIBSY|nr:hypothetical protein F3Y22_tig00111852pilonHSYRG00029 [Hibiscus syriacus]
MVICDENCGSRCKISRKGNGVCKKSSPNEVETCKCLYDDGNGDGDGNLPPKPKKCSAAIRPCSERCNEVCCNQNCEAKYPHPMDGYSVCGSLPFEKLWDMFFRGSGCYRRASTEYYGTHAHVFVLDAKEVTVVLGKHNSPPCRLTDTPKMGVARPGDPHNKVMSCYSLAYGTVLDNRVSCLQGNSIRKPRFYIGVTGLEFRLAIGCIIGDG